MGMAKFSIFGLVSLNLGWNWTKKKVFASWAFVRNFKIITTLAIFLAVFNLAALYFINQNAITIEKHKRDSGDINGKHNYITEVSTSCCVGGGCWCGWELTNYGFS